MTHPYIYTGLSEQGKILSMLGRKIDDVEQILAITCNTLNVPMEGVLSSSRKRELVEARCIAIGLTLTVNKKITLMELGRIFSRDHSTIIYNRNLYDDLYKSDKDFTKKADSVLKFV